ncbi:MAG: LuxR C-terminal-related transcriptional regulator [Eubacteriales bacterium]|nr:LuxR C-terminal-related transcriptional regulator [Eubacteriales bacterium]
MEYLSVEQYAAINDIHLRTVQRHCQAGIIPGAVKLGSNWLIPRDLDTLPGVGREGKTAQFSRPVTVSLEFASGQADAYLQSLPCDPARWLARGLFAYYRCEYAESLASFDHIPKSNINYLTARLFTMYAAICLGDFERYRQTRGFFDNSPGDESRTPEPHYVLECFQANINASLFITRNTPEWLKKGDLSVLPPSMRDLAWYTYIKYLQINKDYRVMLAAAEARISKQDPGYYSLSDIYVYLYAALGHLKQDNPAQARDRMMTVMRLALPDRFIGPFVETLTIMQGLTERCLMEAFPEKYDLVISRWKGIFPQWLRAHNEFAAYSIPEILTRREHQVAMYAADGLNNPQIAQKMFLSLSTVKKDLSCIYDKLGITCRRELKNLF